MAAIAWSDVVGIAAQLASVSGIAQSMILAHVNSNIAVALLGGEDAAKTKLARVMLAAHFGEIEHRRGNGQLTSETIAAEEIRFDYERTQTDDDLRTTSYGSSYLGIINASAARVGFVI